MLDSQIQFLGCLKLFLTFSEFLKKRNPIDQCARPKLRITAAQQKCISSREWEASTRERKECVTETRIFLYRLLWANQLCVCVLQYLQVII
jgi:hypothetical protein